MKIESKSVRLRPSHSPISLLLHGTITYPTKPEKKNNLQTYVGCGYVSSQESYLLYTLLTTLIQLHIFFKHIICAQNNNSQQPASPYHRCHQLGYRGAQRIRSERTVGTESCAPDASKRRAKGLLPHILRENMYSMNEIDTLADID